MWMWGPFVSALLWAHPHQSPPRERCTLRVAAKGIYADGDLMSRDQAIAMCKRTSGAVVNVADDAPPTAWPELRSRLEREHITIHLRGVIDDRACTDNPLAKGCNVVIPKACLDNPLANGCH